MGAQRESYAERIERIENPLIRQGVQEAIERTLLPALGEYAYPGHFTVEADGRHFGKESTYPGLDAWELAGAYMLLGRTASMLHYFEFVRAAQREDGHIPFAVFPEEEVPKLDFLPFRLPDDVFEFKPAAGHDEDSEADERYTSRQWAGLFTHWVPPNPLGALAPVSYLLLADELFAATGDTAWLGERIGSLTRAAQYLRSRRTDNGLVDGAGFYVEVHSRYRWDGVTQCYTVYAFRKLASLHRALGDEAASALWEREAASLAEAFEGLFWQGDHYAEYIHPEHGLVDFHGLTDVNWAAIGLGVTSDAQAAVVWERMKAEPNLWRGDMPSQLVAKPYLFREWELHERLPFESRNNGPLHDVAAMGRVWYLEALSCLRMNDSARLIRSVELVCRMGERHDWYWYERYQPLQTWDVHPAGPAGYCEYAAILVRVVLGHPELFAAQRDRTGECGGLRI